MEYLLKHSMDFLSKIFYFINLFYSWETTICPHNTYCIQLYYKPVIKVENNMASIFLINYYEQDMMTME